MFLNFCLLKHKVVTQYQQQELQNVLKAIFILNKNK